MKKSYLSKVEPGDLIHMKNENFFKHNAKVRHCRDLGLCPDSCSLWVIDAISSGKKATAAVTVLALMAGVASEGEREGSALMVEVDFKAPASTQVYVEDKLTDLWTMPPYDKAVVILQENGQFHRALEDFAEISETDRLNELLDMEQHFKEIEALLDQIEEELGGQIEEADSDTDSEEGQ